MLRHDFLSKIFRNDNKFWGVTVYKAIQTAKDLGYAMVCFNGTVYHTELNGSDEPMTLFKWTDLVYEPEQ